MLIVLSGIDGSGKSTQIELISDWFSNKSKKFKVLWARGGYTPGMEFLKSLTRVILGKKNIPSGESKNRTKKLNNKLIGNLWISLSIIDLIFFWCFYIKILKYFGYNIICDRYLIDTSFDFERNFKHINFKSNIFWKVLNKMIPEPDFHFVLLISESESQKRSKLKNEPFPDSPETLKWRISKYEEYIKMNVENTYYINCAYEIKYVFNQIIKIINED